jgi:16S rRNA (cytosine1402-N4)-methyltransferase
MASLTDISSDNPQRRHRVRYPGKYPRRFEEKYKEHAPERYAETVAKVIASGKTPAGTHRPIMVGEILEALVPKSGEIGVDCTVGYGGHAAHLLPRLLPGGRFLGLDTDPIELPKTETRLRALGFGPDVLSVHRGNYAGLSRVLTAAGLSGVDLILADLGVSSMQLDDPGRGFSAKFEGALDMRMNPSHGQPASALLQRLNEEQLARILSDNADEPRASTLAAVLAGRSFASTTALAGAIRAALPGINRAEQELSERRVFQALRIEVNDEFSALEALLRQVPERLNPKGRVAILSFHSGEDRRVKKAFEAGLRSGCYAAIAPEVIRASAEERYANPRSASAKLRWAQRGPEATPELH